jgi:hypothetical protein
MAIKYYVKAAISEYQDQAGIAKKRYQTIGIVTETKKGDLMMKLEMIPLLGLKDGSLWCYLNVPDDKPEGKPQGNYSNQVQDDTIPF